MDVTTGREFPFVNPQDDPHKYPRPPPGFRYDIGGRLVAVPYEDRIGNNQSDIQMYALNGYLMMK